MDSSIQKPEKRIKKAENTRRRQKKIKKKDINTLLGKRKRKDEEIYLDDDYDNEITMLDATKDDSDDSLFVSNKGNALNPDDNTDSDSDSGGIILTNFTSMESETKVKEIIYRRQTLKKGVKSKSSGTEFTNYLRKLYIPLRAN